MTKKKIVTTACALVLTAGLSLTTFTACGEKHTHTYATTYSSDATYHWKAPTCDDTEDVTEKAEHTFGSDNKCSVCGYTKATSDDSTGGSTSGDSTGGSTGGESSSGGDSTGGSTGGSSDPSTDSEPEEVLGTDGIVYNGKYVYDRYELDFEEEYSTGAKTTAETAYLKMSYGITSGLKDTYIQIADSGEKPFKKYLSNGSLDYEGTFTNTENVLTVTYQWAGSSDTETATVDVGEKELVYHTSFAQSGKTCNAKLYYKLASDTAEIGQEVTEDVLKSAFGINKSGAVDVEKAIANTSIKVDWDAEPAEYIRTDFENDVYFTYYESSITSDTASASDTSTTTKTTTTNLVFTQRVVDGNDEIYYQYKLNGNIWEKTVYTRYYFLYDYTQALLDLTYLLPSIYSGFDSSAEKKFVQNSETGIYSVTDYNVQGLVCKTIDIKFMDGNIAYLSYTMDDNDGVTHKIEYTFTNYGKTAVYVPESFDNKTIGNMVCGKIYHYQSYQISYQNGFPEKSSDNASINKEIINSRFQQVQSHAQDLFFTRDGKFYYCTSSTVTEAGTYTDDEDSFRLVIKISDTQTLVVLGNIDKENDNVYIHYTTEYNESGYTYSVTQTFILSDNDAPEDYL
jgi:hypothetical protein